MINSSLTLLSLAAAALAAVVAPMSVDSRIAARQMLQGRATYFAGDLAIGHCSFSTYTLPPGLYGTALSSLNWDTAANCGGCVAVTSDEGKTITAMIVDECPGCASNSLDLFTDTFAAVASPSRGNIPISWAYVPCPDVSGGLEIHMMTGVSSYWFEAQVVNAHRRTNSMEVSTNQGASWITAMRTTYNYFLIDGGVGSNTVWIRVTSHVGTQVVVKDVLMQSDAIFTANSNYA